MFFHGFSYVETIQVQPILQMYHLFNDMLALDAYLYQVPPCRVVGGMDHCRARVRRRGLEKWQTHLGAFWALFATLLGALRGGSDSRPRRSASAR